MKERLLILPLEFWLGTFTIGCYFAEQDSTLLIMSVVLLGTSRILLEMRK